MRRAARGPRELPARLRRAACAGRLDRGLLRGLRLAARRGSGLSGAECEGCAGPPGVATGNTPMLSRTAQLLVRMREAGLTAAASG
eukprot:jgi/Tetstr1/459162/TSEL_004608.t1